MLLQIMYAVSYHKFILEHENGEKQNAKENLALTFHNKLYLKSMPNALNVWWSNVRFNAIRNATEMKRSTKNFAFAFAFSRIVSTFLNKMEQNFQPKTMEERKSTQPACDENVCLCLSVWCFCLATLSKWIFIEVGIEQTPNTDWCSSGKQSNNKRISQNWFYAMSHKHLPNDSESISEL